MLRGRLEEKVERVVNRQLSHQIDLDPKLTHLFRKRQAGHIIALRILLPVDEMLCRRDSLRVRQNGGTAVRSGAQPHEVRPQRDKSIVLVVGDVVQGDVDAHAIVSKCWPPSLWRA